MTKQRQAKLNSLLLAEDWPAVKNYLDSIHPDKFDGQTYFAKGVLLAFGKTPHKKITDAIHHLEIAHRLAPTNIHYLNTLSEAYLQAKRPTMALHTSTQTTLLAPGDLFSAIALGRAAWFCGEKELSQSSLRKAYHLTPPNQIALKEHLQAIIFGTAAFWREPCLGKRISLVRMELKHRDFLLSCRRNTKFQHQYNLFQDISSNAIERDLQACTKPPIETKRICWIVEKNGQPIGLAELVDLNLINSRLEFLIGFPEEQPFGISLEATLLVIEFAFSKIGAHKLISYVYGDNPNSQRNTLHLGFQQEGLLKSHVVDPVSGERLDLYINGYFIFWFFSKQKAYETCI